jgi:(E)-4-hydroxy-3-methylbut-2-enyl-diphosphate synthase
MGLQGMVSSSAALGILLNEGIGDTIRVSLTPEPGQCRSREVLVAREILQALQLRAFSPRITACPGCGRTDSAEYLELAETIRHFIDTQMPEWKTRYPGIENLTIAVMGCVVNGPGESRHADIGISLPGKSEDPKAPVYVDGKKTAVLQGPTIATEFEQIISAYVQARYGHQIH